MFIVNGVSGALLHCINFRVATDPCCGSGGMFVQSAKFIQAHSGNRGAIAVYGQEANADTWKMAKINMAIRGIDADFGAYQADTFTNDLHPTLKADFVLANPPFNYHPWNQEKLTDDVRWKYGLPPAGNANYAWIQHMIHHLAPHGKIGLVLANGALSTQSSGEGEIRKRIIQDDLIEGIVALPTQLFYSVTIPVTLWFITKGKKQAGKTLFIDARKLGYMVDRKHRDFTEADIAKIADTFEAFQNGTLEDVKGFCAVATLQDIEKQDYILTPGRYVGIEEQEDDGEPFEEKMARLTSELSDMFTKSHELEDEIRRKLGQLVMKSNLSTICDYRKGKVDVATLTHLSYISTENMLPNKGGITSAASLPTISQTQEYRKGDVLVSNIRPYFKKIWKAKTDGGCSNDVLVFAAKDGTDPDFLYYVLADDSFFEYSMATSKGTKMPRGDKTSIMRYQVPAIDISTQRRIASILRSLDDKIELNTAINNNLAA